MILTPRKQEARLYVGKAQGELKATKHLVRCEEFVIYIISQLFQKLPQKFGTFIIVEVVEDDWNFLATMKQQVQSFAN